MDYIPDHVDAPLVREETVLDPLGFDITRVEPLSLYQEAIAYRETDGTRDGRVRGCEHNT